jgi:hypothetical protein
MRKFILLFGLILTMALFGQGKGKGHAKGNSDGNSKNTANSVAASVIFSDSDRSMIQQWVHGVSSNGLPPGLAKRRDLPPGLQKHLQRNGTLPPGLQKKISPFPSELTMRLGPLPNGCGCDRIFLDGKALIIARATSAVLDVIRLF